ncbi:MAG: hypothetical protein SGJ18_08800, partial [Pseudomonadota bacterium]|nr:hypothetical protein [Pseudomonadota bacterium]
RRGRKPHAKHVSLATKILNTSKKVSRAGIRIRNQERLVLVPATELASPVPMSDKEISDIKQISSKAPSLD